MLRGDATNQNGAIVIQGKTATFNDDRCAVYVCIKMEAKVLHAGYANIWRRERAYERDGSTSRMLDVNESTYTRESLGSSIQKSAGDV